MQRPLPIVLAACLLAACGQTGGLYLPDEGVTTPVEIRPAAATVPTAPAAEQPVEEEDEESPAAPPPGTGN
jgi:predicted small lipoprotein YifL